MTSEGGESTNVWHEVFTDPEHPGGRAMRRIHRLWKHVPGNPRCRVCSIPLGGVAAPLLKLTKRSPASGNPNFCNSCELFIEANPGGTELEMTLLFADVRGSTGLAETMGPGEFAGVMHHFYQIANKTLIQGDAWMEKPSGDEIIALYLPIFAGEHARKAVEGAHALLAALADAATEVPIEVGGGVHTGLVYLGTVGVEGSDSYDLTVLGDTVNVTARLASLAAAGEMLVSDDVIELSGMDITGLEHRTLDIRGRAAPLGVYVMSQAERPVS